MAANPTPAPRAPSVRPPAAGRRRQVHRRATSGPRGPRARAQAAGDVHRRHGQERLPPPALGDRRQLRSTRRSTATPSASRSMLDADGKGATVDRRRPRHPRRHPPEEEAAGARDDPLHAALGRQVRQRQLQGLAAACTASGRASSTRSARASTPRVLRDGFEHTQTFSRGTPTSKLKKRPADAQARHHHPLPARPADLRRQAPLRRRASCASGSRPRRTCTRGLVITFTRRGDRRVDRARPPERHRRLPPQARRRSAARR